MTSSVVQLKRLATGLVVAGIVAGGALAAQPAMAADQDAIEARVAALEARLAMLEAPSAELSSVAAVERVEPSASATRDPYAFYREYRARREADMR